MEWLDRQVAGVLAPLAMWVLASGLDDLILDLSAFWFWLFEKPRARPPAPLAQKRIALLIPAWREDAVIERMLDHNIAAIEYSNYEIFVGVYPNDLRTQSRVMAAEAKHPQVHRVVCPHDGPTSKADCLNWAWQGVLLHEETRGRRFDLVLHHDAEDLIFPKSLDWINRYTELYDMVQMPVLPLPTPWWRLTHGTYCDEFAESHLRGLHLRQRLGGFLPSCGVGTAYRRSALDRLAWNNGGRLFEPSSLTEDYRMGLDLHRLGCSQILLDARELGERGIPAATREYFPRRWRGAVRQKARWVAGIALQCWQEVGWNGGGGQAYWLWRDRKGLIGNPLTILANLVFLYGLAGWVWAQAAGQPWRLGELVKESPGLLALLAVNTGLIVVRQAARASCVWQVYGRKQAVTSPLRAPWGNLINCAASLRAIGLFLGAQLRRRPLHWLKTDHHYPTRQTLMAHKRRLGDVLVQMGLLTAPQIEWALEARRPGERIGESLVRRQLLGEGDVYRALGVQQGLPFEPLEREAVRQEALRRLPRDYAERKLLLPVRVAGSQLWVAACDVPTDTVADEVERLSGLKPRFQLITPTNYQALHSGCAT